MELKRAQRVSRDMPASVSKDRVEILSSEWAGDSTRVGSSTFDYRERAKPLSRNTFLEESQPATSEFGRFSTTTRNRPWNSQIDTENHPQSAPFGKRKSQLPPNILSERVKVPSVDKVVAQMTGPGSLTHRDEKPENENYLMGTQNKIKDKLHDIRELFATDDLADVTDRNAIRNKLEKAAANLQNWDLEGHKIMYEEAIGQRRKQLDTFTKIEVPFRPIEAGQPAAHSPSKNVKENDFKTTEYVFEGERINLPDLTFDISDRDMREFLVQRILQLKMHTFGQVKSEINSENRYKFKASTLYNLQPSHERKKYVKALTGEPISAAQSSNVRQQISSREQTPMQAVHKSHQLDDISEIKEVSKVDESICMHEPMNKTFQPVSGLPGDGFTNETTLKQMIEGEMPQEEQFFSFIQKLRDPNAGKNLSARERNFFLCLKDALFKIDKEFEKKEKLETKERRNCKSPEHMRLLAEKARKRQEKEEARDGYSPEKEIEEPVTQEQVRFERLIVETQRLEELEEAGQEIPMFQSHDQSITQEQQAQPSRTISHEDRASGRKPKKSSRVKTTTDGRKIDLAEYAASSGEQLSGSRYQSGDTIGINTKKKAQPEMSQQQTLVCVDKSEDILANPLQEVTQNDVVTQANAGSYSIPFTEASVHMSGDKAQPFKSEAAQNTARTGGSDVNYQTSMGIDDLHIADQSQFIPDANNVMKGPYFCPKRFNRFPRFSIFIKDDQTNSMNKYEQENTVSLSPEFLSILMENKDQAILQAVQNQRNTNNVPSQNARIAVSLKSLDDAKLISQLDQTGEEYLIPENIENDEAGTGAGEQLKSSYMPPDVIQWNEYMKSKFDPFEKVVLIKGIDNSILTSYRTLKGENNTVSDTYKIVHKKFLPQEMQQQRFYKAMLVNRAKNNLYPITVNEMGEEEFEDITAAELTKGGKDLESQSAVIESSSPTNRESINSTNTKKEHLQSVLKQTETPPSGAEEQNEEDKNSQVWQHISLNQLAKKSSLAGQQQQKLEKGRSMKQSMPGIKQQIPNENIDISSQDLLDHSAMDQQLQYVSSQTWNRRSPGIDKVVINEQSHHGEEPNSIEVNIEKDTLGDSQGPPRGKFGTGQLHSDQRLSQDPIVQPQTNVMKGMSVTALQPSSSKMITSRVSGLQFDITRIRKGPSPAKDSMSAWNAQLNSSNANETIDSMINGDLNLLAQDPATFGPPAGYTPTGVFINSKPQRNPFKEAQKKRDDAKKRPEMKEGRREKKKQEEKDKAEKKEEVNKAAPKVVKVPEKKKAPVVATVFFAKSGHGQLEYQAIAEEQSILVDNMNENSKGSDIPTVHNNKSAETAEDASISQMKQNTVSEEQPSQGVIRSPVLSASSELSPINRTQRSAMIEQTTFQAEMGSPSSSVSPRPIFMRKVTQPKAVTRTRKSVSPPGSPIMSDITSPNATPEPRKSSIVSSMMEKVVQKMQTQSRVGPIIDSLYKKERKYVSNADKDNYLNYRSPIFELQKYHALKTNPILCTTIEAEDDSDEDTNNSRILNAHKKQSSLSPRMVARNKPVHSGHKMAVMNTPGQQEWYTKKMQLLKSDIPLLQGSASPVNRFNRSEAVSDGRNRSSDGDDTTTQVREGIYTSVKRDVNSPFIMNIRQSSNNGAQSLGGPFVIPSGASSKYQLQNHTNTTHVLNQGAHIVRETTDSYSKINVGGVTVDSLAKSKAVDLKKTAYPSQSTVGGPTNRQQITDGEYTDPADTTTYHNEEIYGHNQPFGFIGNSSAKKD